MASTYSTNLAIELIGTGDQAGSWGNTTNTNLGTLIEQAISGYVTEAMTTGATNTITIPNGASGTARNMFIEMTGTGGSNTFLVVPANKKLYFIYNNTTGAVTVKVSGQTGVSVSAGEKTILVSNGTDVVPATSFITSASGSSANITTLTGSNLSYTSGNITTLTGTTLGFTSANITTATGTSSTFTTTSDAVGNVRKIPQVGSAKTSVYTLTVSDVGQYVQLGTGGAVDVPNGVFSAGDAVSIFNNTSSGATVSLTITTAYISGTDTDKNSVTLATRGVATVLFISNSVCVVTGSVT